MDSIPFHELFCTLLDSNLTNFLLYDPTYFEQVRKPGIERRFPHVRSSTIKIVQENVDAFVLLYSHKNATEESVSCRTLDE